MATVGQVLRYAEHCGFVRVTGTADTAVLRRGAYEVRLDLRAYPCTAALKGPQVWRERVYLKAAIEFMRRARWSDADG